jgi:hypothetical protein
MTAPEPMARLAAALEQAAEASRQALDAIAYQIPGNADPDDWYQRCGQLHTLTLRTSELCDTVADHISYLWPNPRIYAAAGNDAHNRIHLASAELRDAARAVGVANTRINEAWTQVGQLGMRDEGGQS